MSRNIFRVILRQIMGTLWDWHTSVPHHQSLFSRILSLVCRTSQLPWNSFKFWKYKRTSASKSISSASTSRRTSSASTKVTYFLKGQKCKYKCKYKKCKSKSPKGIPFNSPAKFCHQFAEDYRFLVIPTDPVFRAFWGPILVAEFCFCTNRALH